MPDLETDLNRHLFEPSPQQLLFHYCSMDSFAAIINTSHLRFSDITMMNDYSELRWGYERFAEVAAKLVDAHKEQPEYSELRGFLDEIFASIAPSENPLHPLVACFSLDGDVLSQWRSYADDGAGVAIGFLADDICEMSAHFQRCQYVSSGHDDYLAQRLLAAFAIRNEYSTREHAHYLFGMLPALKNPAFIEEQEIRAVHMLLVQETTKGIQLTDPGGHGFGQTDISREVEFSVRRNGLVAHVDLPFFAGRPKGISKVVLGPKNQNHGNNVLAFLTQNGFENVEVIRSTATYR